MGTYYATSVEPEYFLCERVLALPRPLEIHQTSCTSNVS